MINRTWGPPHASLPWRRYWRTPLRRTLFRIIDSSSFQCKAYIIKDIADAVIHYLANASLQSWFKNRVELLIHSSFYECIKCQTVTNQNSLISFLREQTSKNRILCTLCLMRGPDGCAHSQWRRKSCRCRLSILDHVKGLAIILQPKGDHLICPQINKEPAGIITMHLMMLLFLWHALVKLMI